MVSSCAPRIESYLTCYRSPTCMRSFRRMIDMTEDAQGRRPGFAVRLSAPIAKSKKRKPEESDKANEIHDFQRIRVLCKQEKIPEANLGRLMTCNKIWFVIMARVTTDHTYKYARDRLQSMEKFRNGEIDVDELCAELRWRARCSEGGAVVAEEDVDKIFEKIEFSPFVNNPSANSHHNQSIDPSNLVMQNGNFKMDDVLPQETLFAKAGILSEAQQLSERLQPQQQMQQQDRQRPETTILRDGSNGSTNTPRQDHEEYVVSCICRSVRDDGNIVFCEECETWQHIECYYPSRRVPDIHSCTTCGMRSSTGNSTHQHKRSRRSFSNIHSPGKLVDRPAMSSFLRQNDDPFSLALVESSSDWTTQQAEEYIESGTFGTERLHLGDYRPTDLELNWANWDEIITDLSLQAPTPPARESQNLATPT